MDTLLWHSKQPNSTSNQIMTCVALYPSLGAERRPWPGPYEWPHLLAHQVQEACVMATNGPAWNFDIGHHRTITYHNKAISKQDSKIFQTCPNRFRSSSSVSRWVERLNGVPWLVENYTRQLSQLLGVSSLPQLWSISPIYILQKTTPFWRFFPGGIWRYLEVRPHVLSCFVIQGDHGGARPGVHSDCDPGERVEIQLRSKRNSLNWQSQRWWEYCLWWLPCGNHPSLDATCHFDRTPTQIREPERCSTA